MAGLAPTSTLERLARERARWVMWLAGRFRGRLSYEDCEDIVADTLPRLAEEERLPGDPLRVEAYVRRALYRDALDELKQRHGRSVFGPRPQPVALEHASEVADPDASAPTPLEERQEREAQRSAVARTLAQLPRRDAEVLRLRYLEQLPWEDVAGRLGLSRDQYRRRLSNASRRALDALVSAQSGPACPHVRRLIADAPHDLLERTEAAWRDAHLSECVHCQAFARRAAGALQLLPVPAAGVLDRIGARLGGLLGRGGESVSAVRDGHDAAVAGGVGAAGAALSAGIGTKVVIGCVGAAAAALCAAPLAQRTDERPRERAVATATPEPTPPTPTRSAVPRRTPPIATVAATRTPAATSTPRPRGGATPDRA